MIRFAVAVLLAALLLVAARSDARLPLLGAGPGASGGGGGATNCILVAAGNKLLDAPGDCILSQ